MEVQEHQAPHAAAVARALAVEQDRVIRAAAQARSYDEPSVYRMILRAYPRCGVTARLWRDMAGSDRDYRGERQDTPDAERLAGAMRRYRDVDLAQVEADRAAIEADRAPPLPDMPPAPAPKPVPAPVAEDEDEDEAGTCACDDCDDRECNGDCSACGDHGCEQCWGTDSGNDCEEHDCRHHYPDGCPDTYGCCGYCEDCDRCTGEGRDEVCDKDRCHGCDHSCQRD